MFLPLHFSLNPRHNYIYKIILLHLTQFPSRLHFMPLSDALPAACCRCMLGNKYRMTTHWCLFTIICYVCRSFSFCNKILCMLSDCFQPFSFMYSISFCFKWKLLRNLELSSRSNNCLYHSSLVIKTPLLPAHV